MPRANNVFIPSHVWHITHRCHQNEVPLKYRRDRYRWLYRLFEARKRYGMCVFNDTVTSNHVHLLVKDRAARPLHAAFSWSQGERARDKINARRAKMPSGWAATTRLRWRATPILPALWCTSISIGCGPVWSIIRANSRKVVIMRFSGLRPVQPGSGLRTRRQAAVAA